MRLSWAHGAIVALSLTAGIGLLDTPSRLLGPSIAESPLSLPRASTTSIVIAALPTPRCMRVRPTCTDSPACTDAGPARRLADRTARPGRATGSAHAGSAARHRAAHPDDRPAARAASARRAAAQPDADPRAGTCPCPCPAPAPAPSPTPAPQPTPAAPTDPTTAPALPPASTPTTPLPGPVTPPPILTPTGAPADASGGDDDAGKGACPAASAHGQGGGHGDGNEARGKACGHNGEWARWRDGAPANSASAPSGPPCSSGTSGGACRRASGAGCARAGPDARASARQAGDRRREEPPPALEVPRPSARRGRCGPARSRAPSDSPRTGSRATGARCSGAARRLWPLLQPVADRPPGPHVLRLFLGPHDLRECVGYDATSAPAFSVGNG